MVDFDVDDMNQGKSARGATEVSNAYTLRMPQCPSNAKQVAVNWPPAERAYPVGRRDAGESFGKFSDQTGIPKTTVQSVVKNAQKCNTTESLPCTGLRKTDIRIERRLCREVRKDATSRRVPLKEGRKNYIPCILRVKKYLLCN